MATSQELRSKFKASNYQGDINLGAAPAGPQPTDTPVAPVDNPYNATFRATGDESILGAGLKSAGNVPSSAINLGKGLFSAAASPIETGKGLFSALVGGGRKIQGALSTGVEKAFGVEDFGRGENAQADATFDTLVGVMKERYGSLENAERTAIEDPFGVGLDILGVLTGGAALTGRTAQLSNVISKTGKIGTAPVKAVASKVAPTAKFGTSQATGLQPSTISTITSKTDDFARAQATGLTREQLAGNVEATINQRLDDLSDLGKGFETIRESGAKVNIPETFIPDELAKFGLNVDDAGKVTATTKSTTRSSADINAIQKLVDNWRGKSNLDADEFLNLRSDLSDLAKFDKITGAGKTKASETIAKQVRVSLNKFRDQVEGLKDLDTQYADEVSELNQIKREYINPQTGGLKDTALSRIANITGKGKEQALDRLKQIVPDIEDKVQIIRALEDVENTMGIKVGTYTRAGLVGGQLAFGNVPGAIVTAILTAPEVAVPILKTFGYTRQTVAPVIQAVKQALDDINNLQVPGALQNYIDENYGGKVPLGLSTQPSVIRGKGLDTAEQFIDHIRGVRRVSGESLKDLKFEAQRIAESVGIDPVLSDRALANALAKQLDAQNFAR